MKVTASVVEGFVGSILSKNYDTATVSPKFHKELWQEACSDQQHIAIAAPRGHAKSTAGTMAYGLAMLLFREARYCVIVSDTEAQAVMFLQNIKTELLENELIRDLFSLRKDDKGLAKLEKDSEADLIIAFEDGHKCRIQAKGAEQRLRGMLWNGTRPDLIICDDLENDELVMNKERRLKLRRWFYSALLPILSPTGKFRMWGTILHMDSLLQSVMPSEWAKSCLEEHLRVWDPNQKGMWRSVKYRAHNEDFTEFLWPERFDANYFKTKKAEALRQGIPDSYSQEYLNNPIDESVSYLRRGDFQALTEEQKGCEITYYITADLAISEKETADYSVFIIGGMDEHRRLQIRNVIRERMDGREIVDTIMQLHDTYRPMAFGIEEMQVSKAIGPFLREEMIRRGSFPSLIALKHGGKDKIARGKSMQARLRARTVFFDKSEDWYPTFEDECLKFPRAKHDDQPDALFYLGLLLDRMIEYPDAEEIAEDEYEEELNESQRGDYGRSAITGY